MMQVIEETRAFNSKVYIENGRHVELNLGTVWNHETD